MNLFACIKFEALILEKNIAQGLDISDRFASHAIHSHESLELRLFKNLTQVLRFNILLL